MANIVHIQSNFTAGEISPRLFGRVDLSKYNNGAKTFEVEMERLDTGATSTGSTPVGLDPTQNSAWWISQASHIFWQSLVFWDQ